MDSDLKSDNSNTKKPNINHGIKINPLKLIRLVRANEAIYNSSASGYNDKPAKDIIWERIIRGLFPLFDTYQPSIQDTIRTSVRRRWKTLRDSVSREAKRSVTLENYWRKIESTLISELEFLLPHIKSPYCAKLADELGLREGYSTTKPHDEDDEPQDEDTSYINNNNNDTNCSNEDSLNNLIDLTEECDLKPFIKQDAFAYDDMETEDDSSPYSPHVQLVVGDGNGAGNNTNAAQTCVGAGNNTNEAQTCDGANDSIPFCTVAQFKEGEFINPPELCANQEVGGVELGSREMEKERELEKSSNTVELNSKRARSMPGEPVQQQQSVHELQAKILQLLSSIESRDRTECEANDEDRMFLLSLVSDLKRVPAAKKMKIKMEIVTAIARANQ